MTIFPFLPKMDYRKQQDYGGSNMLRVVFLSVSVLGMTTNVWAQPIDTYWARLSKQDHYNSSGVALNSAATIIRQDRANFYIFGKMDPEDESDVFFNDKANRAKLEKMLSEGSLSDRDRAIIENGTPLIRVDIHPEHVEVTVAQD